MGQDTTEREILKDILGPARMVPLNVWLSTRLSACRASPTVLGENNFQRTITWCISFPGLLEEITTTLVGKVKKKIMFSILEVYSQFHWTKIKMLAGPRSLQRLKERIHSLLLQTTWESWAWDCITPTSASMVTLPSLISPF